MAIAFERGAFRSERSCRLEECRHGFGDAIPLQMEVADGIMHAPVVGNLHRQFFPLGNGRVILAASGQRLSTVQYLAAVESQESLLRQEYRGAAGNFNQLVGDVDGRIGSGRRGFVVIDSGDPQAGFKSYDWWGPIRAYKKGWSAAHTEESFSAIGWDRWTLSHLYVTGGDGGLFLDLVDKAEPFSVRVEDCISIGRAFGGGLANILSRADEPSRFVRCQLWCLDWWGDAAGAYVRAEHPQPPIWPDVVFEDCTLVGPDNALQAGNPGYEGYTRVALTRCRLVSLGDTGDL